MRYMEPKDERVRAAWADSFNRDMLTRVLTDKNIHPDDVATLARWAPLGMTHLSWRNSILEDWHAGPDSQISDGGMFMANVATTRIYNWAIEEMLTSWEIDRVASLDDIHEIEADSFAYFLLEAAEDATDPERVLPHGPTLADIGGPEVHLLGAHAQTQAGSLADMADEHGTDLVLLWLATRGILACDTWWGGAGWPPHVDRFLNLLDNPGHDHWHGKHPGTPPKPATDRDWFRYTLLTRPDELGIEVADWCTQRAAIGYARP